MGRWVGEEGRLRKTGVLHKTQAWLQDLGPAFQSEPLIKVQAWKWKTCTYAHTRERRNGAHTWEHRGFVCQIKLRRN